MTRSPNAESKVGLLLLFFESDEDPFNFLLFPIVVGLAGDDVTEFVLFLAVCTGVTAEIDDGGVVVDVAAAAAEAVGFFL